jgi:hypothetical protein
MPDNNFEKRLQEQMEGFKLQPSEQVWDEVELRIRKKRTDAGLFFGGWYLLCSQAAAYLRLLNF